MYNANKPNPEELPSSEALLRSTFIAAGAAAAILVTVVLPAEYGIDPTRIGGLLGLTEMGEIKQELAEEAAADEQAAVGGFLFGAAMAQEAEVWKDEISFTLTPGQGIEWKLAMDEGAIAEYRWFTDGARINFDLHGDGSGKSVTYERGRGKTADEGEITAAFDGQHGWFWRNRDKTETTVIVQLRGDYAGLKQTY